MTSYPNLPRLRHWPDEDPHSWGNTQYRHNSLMRPVSKVRLQNASNGEFLELEGNKLVTRPRREGGNKVWAIWTFDLVDGVACLMDESQGTTDPVITMEGLLLYTPVAR